MQIYLSHLYSDLENQLAVYSLFKSFRDKTELNDCWLVDFPPIFVAALLLLSRVPLGTWKYKDNLCGLYISKC